jgi:hypothetical protein
MWIMLIEKLPTVISPPKFGIFWSTEWINGKIAAQQKKRLIHQYHDVDRYDKREVDVLWDHTTQREDRLAAEPFWGWEPNEARARGILYGGEKIKVYPHEYSEMTPEKMRLYVFGDEQGDGSHILIEDTTSVADEILIRQVLDGETRPIYEAALIDGASHAQAMATAFGMDITIPEAEFPPIGWYQIVPEYGLIFATEDELRG